MITPAPGRSRLINSRGNVLDVAEAMRMMILEAAERPTVHRIAEYMRGSADCSSCALENAANWAYKAAYFMPDLGGQYMRSPERTVRDGLANCVDYSILLGSFGVVHGLPVTLRLVELPGQGQLGHVYPIINGVPVDVVPGQNQQGFERIRRKPGQFPRIGDELAYIRKRDIFVT